MVAIPLLAKLALQGEEQVTAYFLQGWAGREVPLLLLERFNQSLYPDCLWHRLLGFRLGSPGHLESCHILSSGLLLAT